MFQQGIQRRIKYQAELDGNFAKEIASTPGCDNLFSCIQCGKCSGTCPLSIYMDYTPRRVIAMTRAGFKEEVLQSQTIWLCASCYSCTVECPKEIKITDVMYALKQRAIRDKVYPKRFPTPILAREFFSSIWKYGRNTESWLIVRMYLKSNPFKMIAQSLLGFNLWRTGRMGLKPESIKDRTGLQRLLEAVEQAEPKESRTPAGKRE